MNGETTMTEQPLPEEAQPAVGGNDSEDELHEEEAETHEDRRDQRTRSRLREVEAERDTYAERIANMQRRERDRIALEYLPEAALSMVPADIPTDGDGDVDEDAVIEQARVVLDLIRSASPVHHADLGPRQSVKPKRQVSWAQVLQNKGGRG